MVSITIPNAKEAVLGAIGLLVTYYAIYYVYWQFTVGASRRKIIKEHGCKPVKHAPSRDPFGISTIFENRRYFKAHKILERSLRRFREIGPTFQIKILNRSFRITIEPENLKQIQSIQFKNWSLGHERIRTFRTFLGEGIFTTDGASWSHSREMLRPNFVRSQVGDLATFQQHVDYLIQAIPRDGTTVDLSELFFKLTIDSATEFLFGESTNTLAPGASSKAAKTFADAFNRAQEAVSGRSEGWWYKMFGDRQFQSDVKYCRDFIDEFVEKGFQQAKTQDVEKGGRYIFLNELIKETQDKIRIRSELLNILLAGRDTTASLLTNVFFVLGKRPDIWEKLQEEVGQLNGEAPTYNQIKDMKYLRFVMNESLRYHPVVPGNSRQAIVDTWLPLGGGSDGQSPMFVPKDMIIAWSVFSMHRRKDFYGEDAEDFKPERWEKLRPGWEYLPFNGGPRICIGQQYALSEASYTTVRLLQEFKTIESRDDQPWTEWLTLTCTSLNGAKVALTPR